MTLSRRELLEVLAAAPLAAVPREVWRCSWCGARSQEPASGELVVCPHCGTRGCLAERMMAEGRRYRIRLYHMPSGTLVETWDVPRTES